jgi:hypothetical protein
MRMQLAAALTALAALSAGPVSAADYLLFPTNVLGPDGRYGPALEVQIGARVDRFTVVSGAIPGPAVSDPRRAFAWVRDRYGLDPSRDRMFFCAGGIPLYTCVDPMDWADRRFPPPSWP